MTTPTPPTADLDLAAIRERADAATPGPWELVMEDGVLEVRNGEGDRIFDAYPEVSDDTTIPGAIADAHFAMRARADVPTLLAEVERLQGELSTVWALADQRGEEIKRLRGEASRAVAEVVGTDRADELLGAGLVGEVLCRGGFLSPTGAVGLRRALARSEAERDEARAAAEAERDLRVGAEDLLLSAIAEAEGLKRELERWTSGQRRKGMPVVTAVPDGLQTAASLARSIGTEGGEEHDALLARASQTMKVLHDAASCLIADRDAMRAVVEAAKAWSRAIEECQSEDDMRAAETALIAAVDALPTPTEAGNG